MLSQLRENWEGTYHREERGCWTHLNKAWKYFVTKVFNYHLDVWGVDGKYTKNYSVSAPQLHGLESWPELFKLPIFFYIELPRVAHFLIALGQKTYQHIGASLSPSESARWHHEHLNSGSRHWWNISRPFLLILLKNLSMCVFVWLCVCMCVRGLILNI